MNHNASSLVWGPNGLAQRIAYAWRAFRSLPTVRGLVQSHIATWTRFPNESAAEYAARIERDMRAKCDDEVANLRATLGVPNEAKAPISGAAPLAAPSRSELEQDYDEKRAALQRWMDGKDDGREPAPNYEHEFLTAADRLRGAEQ